MDLHVHTVFSDGELTPEQTLIEAKERNIKILSFTDHDEVGAYEEGKLLALKLGIHLIPGIELNTDGPDGELHILGYHFDPSSKVMQDHIIWRKAERKVWAQKIVNRLNMLGYNITYEKCLQQSTGDIIVRTHIAEELVDNGYFKTSTEAFETLLKKGKQGFVARAEFSANDAINLIHAAGGEAYLAHPGIYPFEVDIEKITSYELDGIEVYHSKHTKEQTAYFENTALRKGLKISGGSDSHGPNSRNPYAIGSVQLSAYCLKKWGNRVGAIK